MLLDRIEIAQRVRRDFTPHLAKAAWLVVSALHESLEVHVEGRLPEGPVVVAFWHGEQQLILPWRPRQFTALTSLSKDGRLQAGILERFGFRTVAGSSSRGGTRGLLELVKRIRRDGESVAMAVDGPRGPAHIAKGGAVELARLGRAPIVPIRAFGDSVWSFEKSWDAFQLPKPFSKVLIRVGDPFEIKHRRHKGADPSKDLEERLRKLQV